MGSFNLPSNFKIKQLPHGRHACTGCRVERPGDRTDWTLRCSLRAQTKKTHKSRYNISSTVFWWGNCRDWSLDGEDKDYLGFLLAVLFQAVGIVQRAFGQAGGLGNGSYGGAMVGVVERWCEGGNAEGVAVAWWWQGGKSFVEDRDEAVKLDEMLVAMVFRWFSGSSSSKSRVGKTKTWTLWVCRQ